METNYKQQAADFLKSTGTNLTVKYLKHDKYFTDDKTARDIYQFTFIRNGIEFSALFGQSIASTGEQPTAYDILACLTKCDPGTFYDFCSDFGYDSDSRAAEKIYKAVCKEWENVQKIWSSDEIDQLAEIN